MKRFTIFLFLFWGQQAKALIFETNNLKISKSKEDLKKTIKTKRVSIIDPLHKKKLEYLCFPIKDMFKIFHIDFERIDHFIVSAEDGYRVKVEKQYLKFNPCLAYQELNANNKWSTFTQGRHPIDFSPYYLIWLNRPKKNFLPWPYKVNRITVKNHSSSSVAEPKSEDKQVQKGHKLYEKHCLKCHSINLYGGKVGPELNIPQNITEYWEVNHLQRFIKNPGSYRYGSSMPAFEAILSDKNINDILAYLKFMKNHKVIPSKL